MSTGKYVLGFVMVWCQCFTSVAQKTDYNWLAGYASQAGFDSSANYWFGISRFDFNQNPVDLSRDSLGIWFGRGGSMISDSSGQLLFYTNGFRVHNSQDVLMENGDSLGWSYRDATSEDYLYGRRFQQGGICIPDPAGKNRYYFVHTFIDSSLAFGLLIKKIMYCVIDPDANNGKGSVLNKNSVLVDAGNGGALAACKQGNGKDWWLVSTRFNSNCHYLMKADTQGIFLADSVYSGLPTIIGDVAPVRFSPDGNYFISGSTANASINFFAFDRCTGKLTLKESVDSIAEFNTFDSTFYFFSMEVSPNSRYLYTFSQKYVLQWDMWADTIAKSKTIVAVGTDFTFNYPFFHGQLAPDGKIYIQSGNGTPYISIIENPDVGGASCNVVQKVALPTYINGLPHFPNYRLGAKNCGSTGITTQGNAAILRLGVYPNPATNYVITDYGNFGWQESSRLTLTITDNIGRVVYSTPLPQYSGVHKANVSGFASGIYHIIINDNHNNISSGKFVKE